MYIGRGTCYGGMVWWWYHTILIILAPCHTTVLPHGCSWSTPIMTKKFNVGILGVWPTIRQCREANEKQGAWPANAVCVCLFVSLKTWHLLVINQSIIDCLTRLYFIAPTRERAVCGLTTARRSLVLPFVLRLRNSERETLSLCTALFSRRR